MASMATKPGIKLYFRTTPELRGIQELLKGKLRASKALSSNPKYTSSDAIINALLLWASEQDTDELAKNLLPYLSRFREAWKEVLEGDPDDTLAVHPDFDPAHPWVGPQRDLRGRTQRLDAERKEPKRAAGQEPAGAEHLDPKTGPKTGLPLQEKRRRKGGA